MFPDIVYKPSTHPTAQPLWGLGTFETRSVADEAELDAALAEGWTRQPEREPGPPKTAEKPKKVTPQ